MFFKLWQVLFFLYLWVFLVLFSKFIFTLAQNTYKIGIIKRVEKSITMRKKGFSIAEALMVLLIMSIIVAVSMPVLTKKSRRKEFILSWILEFSPGRRSKTGTKFSFNQQRPDGAYEQNGGRWKNPFIGRNKSK